MSKKTSYDKYLDKLSEMEEDCAERGIFLRVFDSERCGRDIHIRVTVTTPAGRSVSHTIFVYDQFVHPKRQWLIAVDELLNTYNSGEEASRWARNNKLPWNELPDVDKELLIYDFDSVVSKLSYLQYAISWLPLGDCSDDGGDTPCQH